MAAEKNIIVVPTDFTVVAECALNHAIGIAGGLNNCEIILLNIVSKEKERAEAEKKISALIDKTPRKEGVKLFPATRVGSIFEDIGGFAEEMNARLVVMGTHGVKGMQYLLGSHAVKVITNSKVPFIVVQERKFGAGYRNIVLPFDLTKESKQKLKMSIEIAKYFSSKVHIYYPAETDEHYRRAVENNVALAKSELKQSNIPFDVTEAKEKSNFVKNMLAYAASVNADMVAVVNSQEAGFPEILAGTDERTIITNDAQIPVLIVNPIKSLYGGSVIFS